MKKTEVPTNTMAEKEVKKEKQEEQEVKLYNDFLAKFPFKDDAIKYKHGNEDDCKVLTLDSYTGLGEDRDDFTYWVERKLRPIGSIVGGSSYKFGVYKCNVQPKKKDNNYKYNGLIGYAWLAKYEVDESDAKNKDDNSDTGYEKAFNKVKKLINEVAKSAGGDTVNYSEIDKIDLGNAYKWMIAFLYSGKVENSKIGEPRLVAVYRKSVLLEAARFLGLKYVDDNQKEQLLTEKLNIGQLQKILMDNYNKKNQKQDENFKDIFSYSHYIWKIGGGTVASAYDILTKYNKQVILYGAPGTGKTYAAEQIIKEFIDDANADANLENYHYQDKYEKQNKQYSLDNELSQKNVIWEMVQFNQSYSYEDFIEGMRPTTNGKLQIVDGIFKRFCNVARENADLNFIFIIDEINRGKIDKIFGELLYLLEYRDKKIRLHYSNEEFSIPDNVYVVGTMNTADKSIALIDVALRRRFWFVRCVPKREVLLKEFGLSNEKIKKNDGDTDENVKKIAVKLFDKLNGKNDEKSDGDRKGILETVLGNDAEELKIGHSYFLKLGMDCCFQDLKNIWFYSVIPLLEEYCGFDKQRLSELCKKFDNNNDFSKVEGFTLENLNKLK